MGKGTGKGYKNIIGTDKRIHSMSAKGIKQPQRINPIFVNKVLSERKIKEKGWNKSRDAPFEISWVNPKKIIKVYVEKPSGVKEWSVYTNFLNKAGEEDFDDFGTFKTKELAIDFAIKYMEKN